VKEWQDEIVFVRRVVPGAADRSYGIQVARLAGMPPSVVTRARHILSGLETGAGLPVQKSVEIAQVTLTAQEANQKKPEPTSKVPKATPKKDVSGPELDLFG
jgi:DNA mismatch repair protein MutS